MSKLERLMNLTALLLDTERPLRASDIRREVPGYPESEAAFRRAFERDKDDLREMGIPIVVEPSPETEPPIDGYRIRKQDYYLDDPGLSQDELAAIQLATRVVRLEGGAGAQGLWKLGGAAGDHGMEDELAAIPSSPHLTPLFAALGAKHLVEFEYGGLGRQVEPWRLDYLRGHWYLSGFDRSRGADRHFRLDRIEGEVHVGDESFSPKRAASPGARMDPWRLGDGDPVLTRLLVDAGWVDEARKRLGTDATFERTPEGGAVFELLVSNVAGFRSLVLGFLDHAEVLEPPEMRAAIVTWLEELATS